MHIRSIFTATCFLLLLGSCAAQIIGYSKIKISDKDLAVRNIEQVFYEQPAKYRPESIVVTDDYLGLSSGTVVETKGVGLARGLSNNLLVGIGSSKSYVNNIKERIYFNSIGEISLFQKRSWFIIQVRHSDGRIFHNIYTKDKSKAVNFISSIYYFVDRS